MPSKQDHGSPQLGPEIPVMYLNQILEMGQKWGLTQQAMLNGTRIHPDLLEDESSSISTEYGAALGLNMLRLSNKRGIGFELGLHLELSAQGQLGRTVLQAKTLGDAADTAYRFAHTSFTAVKLKSETEGKMTSVHLTENFPLGPFRATVHEAILTLLWRNACYVVGEGNHDCEFHFAWPEPKYFAMYRHRLPPVRWSQKSTVLRFPTHYLAQQLPKNSLSAGNATLHELERELLNLGNSPEHIAGRVRRLLKTDAPGFPTLAEVAAELLTSERSLKRRLQTAGTSFRELLNQAMQTEAKRLLLNTNLGLQQISFQLGYKDPATFTHAFRRWTGKAPSKYRKEQNNPETG